MRFNVLDLIRILDLETKQSNIFLLNFSSFLSSTKVVHSTRRKLKCSTLRNRQLLSVATTNIKRETYGFVK